MFGKITAGLVSDLGLFVIRAAVGAVFLFHGSQKAFGVWGGEGLAGFAAWLDSMKMPYPAHAAVLAAAAELLGGAALITGYRMRIMAAPLVPTMAAAIYFVHRDSFSAKTGGMEYPLTLGLAVIGMCLTGPGSLAILHIPGWAWIESYLTRDPGRLDLRESLTNTITESVRQSPQYASLMRQRGEA
jgi:putative oxidoreductase